MNTIVTLTAKNQLTIPSAFAKLLALTQGTRLLAKLNDSVLTLEKIDSSWSSLQGSLQPTNLTKNISSEDIVKLSKVIAAKQFKRHK